MREVEAATRAGKKDAQPKGGSADPDRGEPTDDPVLAALQEALREALGSKVQLRGGDDGKGVIQIPFRSAEDFERVFAVITGREPSEVAG